MTISEIEELLNRHAAELAEHFEAVEIMVSRTEFGKTTGVWRGRGNTFARMGLAEEYIRANKDYEQAKEIASHLNAPPEPGDEWAMDGDV